MTDKKKQLMTEEELNKLATKIVSRMVQLKSMEDWYQHVFNSGSAADMEYANLDMTEEEGAIGEAAKLMTLMNLFEDKEEFEKCAIIKRQMDRVNKILKRNSGK
jgi:uncharacterized protein (DUF305 family)